MSHYSYIWLNENCVPYYAGKGSGRRAYEPQRHSVRPPSDKTKIVIFLMESEALAYQSEKALIELFGRKDNGTGILANLSDGGKGCGSGYIPPLEHRQNVSKARKGKPFSAEHRLALSKAKTGKPWTEVQRAVRERSKRGY